MPRAKKKPAAYPKWLFDHDEAFMRPGDGQHCLWLCTSCGAPYWYPRTATKHGGPAWRIKGHPEWSPYEGPCWRSREYGVKCVTPRGVRVLVHEGKDQPPADLMKALEKNARRVRRELKGKTDARI